MNASARVRVAVAVIYDQAGRVLIAKRPKHVHKANHWEFPGGKVEDGEDLASALARELREELDIHPLRTRPLITIAHDYPDKQVSLEVWQVDRFSGEPRGMEGQPIKWVSKDELRDYRFPEANLAIINRLTLPATYLISPEPEMGRSGFLRQLELSLTRSGVRLMQLRANRLSDRDYLSYAVDALAVCNQYGVRLLLNRQPELVTSIGAHGIHLNSKRLLAQSERPLSHEYLVAASCHDRRELDQACRLGVDFVVLGPVNKTRSHPDSPPMGWPGFAELVRSAGVPVYALGGMQAADVEQAQAYNAQGIAAIRSLWRYE